MRLTDIQIRHFRNLRTLDWRPAPGLNLVWGRNGQGKTNLLEALHVALTGRSFRTRRDEELIPWQHADDPADPTLCQVTLRRRSGERRLRVVMGRGFKRAFADQQWLPRLGELLAEASVVVFTPDDAGLFRGAPAGRRRLLDMVLSQISRDYLQRLQQFNQAMKQLAAAYKLRSGEAQAREAARAFEPGVARAGAALIAARAARLAAAGDALAGRHAMLGGQGRLALTYDPGLRRLPPELLEAAAANPRDETTLGALTTHYERVLDQAFAEGRRTGSCPTGAQRDDFTLTLDGHDLRRYGSQGQHRLAALTLKLETASWIESAIGDTPILLLDDFGSELDRGRRQAVLDGLRRSMQVLVTATDPADFPTDGLFDATLRIDGGSIAP